MSTTIGQLKAWLNDCERHCPDVNDQAPVYIDDGGLTLCIDTDLAELYLEIGGKPSDAPLPLFDEPDAFGILYGAEGANFPNVVEDGPYATLAAATAALDPRMAARYDGAMIASAWQRSDGRDIATGKGQVVKVIR